MRAGYSAVLCIGLMGASVAAVADEPRLARAQEPVGFVTGAVIGGFAGGPIGAVLGAGFGTWLGARVHRAGEASQVEVHAALLAADNKSLAASNDELSARLEDRLRHVDYADRASDDQSLLDGLQGDVLFRTSSADITPDVAHQVHVLAQAALGSQLIVRIDGYADPRGGEEANLELSRRRADAVRGLLLAAGLDQAAIKVNAYGKTLSVASDSDGYAWERRVRITLLATDASHQGPDAANQL